MGLGQNQGDDTGLRGVNAPKMPLFDGLEHPVTLPDPALSTGALREPHRSEPAQADPIPAGKPITAAATEIEVAPATKKPSLYGVIKEAAKWALHTFNVKARFKEIVSNFRELKKVQSEDEIVTTNNIKAAQALILKKLGICLAASEGMTYFAAPVTNSVTQFVTKNPQTAITTMAVLGYVIAIGSFDIAWYKANKGYYKYAGKNFKERTGAFVRDVLPLHAVACATAIPCTAFSAFIAGKISTALGHNSQYVPSFPYAMAIFAFCEALPFMLAMTPYLQSTADKFAPKYLEYLDKKNDKKVEQ